MKKRKKKLLIDAKDIDVVLIERKKDTNEEKAMIFFKNGNTMQVTKQDFNDLKFNTVFI